MDGIDTLSFSSVNFHEERSRYDSLLLYNSRYSFGGSCLGGVGSNMISLIRMSLNFSWSGSLNQALNVFNFIALPRVSLIESRLNVNG